MSKYKTEFLQKMESLKKPERSLALEKFFQAYSGGYGEGDKFWGMSVPEQRKVSKEYYMLLTLEDNDDLLKHPVHEVRLTGLMAMVLRYQRSKDIMEKETLAAIYLSNLDKINNWDLVDSSAPHILGPHFLMRNPEQLFAMARSGNLWQQRISIIATQHFIRQGKYDTTLALAEILLNHEHDLIHKAVGWMLREIGDRDYQTEYEFLTRHFRQMPRTMLRYAIEKFDENIRQDFLKGRI